MSTYALDFKITVAHFRRLDIHVPWRRFGRGLRRGLCLRRLHWLWDNASGLDWGVESLSIRSHLCYRVSLGYLGLSRFVEILKVYDNLCLLRIFVRAHSEPFWTVHTNDGYTFLDRLSVNDFLSRIRWKSGCSRDWASLGWLGCHRNRLVVPCP